MEAKKMEKKSEEEEEEEEERNLIHKEEDIDSQDWHLLSRIMRIDFTKDIMLSNKVI